jgi:GTPase
VLAQDVGAADKLFATLDTKIRRAQTAQGQSFLMVDTVGFIQGLPLQLVAAFQATLDEALLADIVVCALCSVHQ